MGWNGQGGVVISLLERSERVGDLAKEGHIIRVGGELGWGIDIIGNREAMGTGAGYNWFHLKDGASDMARLGLWGGDGIMGLVAWGG